MERYRRPLMGQENEYAVGVLDHAECGAAPAKYVEGLLGEARNFVPHIYGSGPTDFYTSGGARLYIDQGLHPEFATPECSGGPWEVVRYRAAGEEILARAARQIEDRDTAVKELLVSLTNVDYVTGATWAGHENYLSFRPVSEHESQIGPHLVTRIIYTGAGGFDNHRPGASFMLSPRVTHLTTFRSPSSTGRRGIIHLKDEPLAKGYRRIHLLCGENLRSHVSDVLRMGTTCLILLASDAGGRPGRGLTLANPLEAMNVVARDPTCSAELSLASGKQATALEIQVAYLERVERYVGTNMLPDWAEELCRLWRDVLDCLAHAPHDLDTVLDWRIKQQLFRRHVENHGLFDWETVQAWSAAASGPQSHFTFGCLAAELPVTIRWTDALRELTRLRGQMCEIDFRYGQVGSNGVFNALDAAGLLSHRLVPPEAVSAAMVEPPQGRAGVRGRVVTRLSKSPRNRVKYRCAWSRVWNLVDSRTLDLSNPYTDTEGPWEVVDERQNRLQMEMMLNR